VSDLKVFVQFSVASSLDFGNLPTHVQGLSNDEQGNQHTTKHSKE
jgi:hypothetical protein